MATLSFFTGSRALGIEVLTSALIHAFVNVIAAGPMVRLVERVVIRFSDEEMDRRAPIVMGTQRRSTG